MKNKAECKQLQNQYEMIRQTWNKIEKSDQNLDLLGYNSLDKLSVSEMMNIFEAIGAAVQKQFLFGATEDNEFRFKKKMLKINKNIDDDLFGKIGLFESLSNMQSTIRTVLPLILSNTIVNRIEDNNQLTQKCSKIGLAMFEENGQYSKVDDWASKASLTSDKKSWVVSAQKFNIIKKDYSHYMLFCRSESADKRFKSEFDSTNDLVVLLVPKELIHIENEHQDCFGIQYESIHLEHVILSREQCEVCSQLSIDSFLNIVGCAHLAVSAVITGVMKQMLKNTYAYLINQKPGLLNCELSQYRLFEATCKVYSLESMLYMAAAMFDSFDKKSIIYNECLAANVVATESSFEVVRDLKDLFGMRSANISSSLEFVHSLGNYVDSTTHSRSRLSNNGIHHFKNHIHLDEKLSFSLKIPVYSTSQYAKYRKTLKQSAILDQNMTKYVHHNLHTICSWISDSINKLSYSTDLLMNVHKKVRLYFFASPY